MGALKPYFDLPWLKTALLVKPAYVRLRAAMAMRDIDPAHRGRGGTGHGDNRHAEGMYS